MDHFIFDHHDHHIFTKLILLLHLSKVSFTREVLDTFLIRLNSVNLADSRILSQHDYADELKELYLKIIHNDKIRNISVNVIKTINCFNKKHVDYDVKIKLISSRADSLFDFILKLTCSTIYFNERMMNLH
jgi:hypothetical protein